MNNQNNLCFKPYEELTFSDDFMFGKTMEDPDLCRQVLECLLQESVGNLTNLQGQKELRYTSDGKPIRLDILSSNDHNTIYDAEMQNLNKKSIESLYLSRRVRFYQSSIDTDRMNLGTPYWRLPDSKILFICTFDPFREGLAQYTFRERCDEKNELFLQDGTEKIFFNCTYTGKDLPEAIRNLYSYIRTGQVNDNLTKNIDNAISQARKRDEWRSMYMKEQAIFMELKEESRKEGQDLLVTAINRLREGASVETLLKDGIDEHTIKLAQAVNSH